ncbi:MAG TPA: ADOP family duplicated permease [Thermoanaerobaculia bacterium]|nr:ADOP family duplicated permease [Thermoanaerobaculia bacterium]
MSLAHELRSRLRALLRWLVRPDEDERELDAELRFHLEMETDKNLASGMSPKEARRRARIDFGGIERTREECRDQRGARGVEDLARDLRQALRRLLREPGFSLPAAVTLALAFGGVLSMFGVLSSVVLRPLPYHDPGRLLRLWSAVPGVGADEVWGVAKAELLHFEREASSFEALGLYRFGASTLGDAESGRPDERVTSVRFSLGLLRALRIEPARGRRPGEADTRPGAEPSVWLADWLWRDRFGADRGIIGARIEIDGRSAEVAGILPPSARLPEELEGRGLGSVGVWSALEIDPTERPQSSHVYRAIGRLAPGATVELAASELTRLTAGLPEALPTAYTERFLESTGFRTEIVPLHEDVLGGIGPILWTLLVALVFLLLIACANVAGLLVARTEARRHDGAVRLALGASRLRLLQEAIGEMLLLCFAAAGAGLGLATAGLRALRVIELADLPRVDEVGLGWETWMLSLALAFAVAVALGVLQARRSGTGRLPDLGGSRGALGRAAAGRFRRVLVVGQVALSTVLLAGAALLAQSYLRLHRVGPGFDPRGVLVFSVLLPEASYGSLERVTSFYRAASERLAELPGVEAVGLGSGLPLEGQGCSVVEAQDAPVVTEAEMACVPVHLVTPGHLAALGVAVQGRETSWEDLASAAAGAVVSEAFARRQWPGGDAIGNRVRIGSQAPFVEVVGVAEDVRGEGLDRPPTEDVYLPLFEGATTPLGGPPHRLSVVVRTTLESPGSIEGSVRATLAELEPRAPLIGFQTMESLVRGSLARREIATRLLATAAGLALILGAVGIFGVLSYVVSRRRAELGLRLALGARGSELARSALSEALGLAALGVLVGTGLALWATRSLRGLLYGVAPGDPGTLAAVGAGLLVVAMVAAVGPARRAARVDPVEALREG